MSDMRHAGEFALAIARSHFVDAHAGVEAAVIARLRLMKLEIKQLLTQNMTTLAKAAPAPQYPKATKAQVDEALLQLREIQDLRNDLVHSPLKLVTIGNASFACFVNPQKWEPHFTRATLLSAEQLRMLARELDRLAAVISPVSRASSPPQPCSAAASGP